jgi:pimeloyl-ACP methyl ester carboxylesterase
VPETTAPDGTALHYETAGEGETVAFLGDAGYGVWQWSWQNDDLAGPFRTLTWDLRGTGRSEDPGGPYTVAELAADFEAVLSASETDRAHLVGAGLGGMIALTYAHQYSRARTLTLFGTAASGDVVDEATLRERSAPADDPDALCESLSSAFTEQFRAEQSGLLDRICAWRQRDDATEGEFDAQVEAVCGYDSPPLYEITVPTLVCHGVGDPVVPVAEGRALAEKLPRGTFEAVEGRHLCFVEHAHAVTDRLVGFLEDNAMA